MNNVTVKCTHSGQKHAYGDTFRTYEIHTPEKLDESAILSLVHNGNKMPYSEWVRKTDDVNEYFRGYYTITETDYGYRYEGVEPYTD